MRLYLSRCVVERSHRLGRLRRRRRLGRPRRVRLCRRRRARSLESTDDFGRVRGGGGGGGGGGVLGRHRSLRSLDCRRELALELLQSSEIRPRFVREAIRGHELALELLQSVRRVSSETPTQWPIRTGTAEAINETHLALRLVRRRLRLRRRRRRLGRRHLLHQGGAQSEDAIRGHQKRQ